MSDGTRLPSTEGSEGNIEDTALASESKLDQLIETAENVRRSVNIRTAFVTVALIIGLVLIVLNFLQTRQVKDIGSGNRANGELLVECTTPGTNPDAKSISDTGNACWDRLHAPGQSSDAIALIMDNIYCDHRRAQAKLPAIDPTRPCRDQTPADVYPGRS